MIFDFVQVEASEITEAIAGLHTALTIYLVPPNESAIGFEIGDRSVNIFSSKVEIHAHHSK